MTKLRSNCDEDDEAVIIQINQGKGCDCHTEGKRKSEAAPFPFKQETNTAFPVHLQERRPTISSEGSESTLSIVSINSPPNKGPLELPLVTPRDHGSHCALEVSVFEKHAEGCSFKKREKEGRHPIDDKSGSYDVVNRMVYHTCAGKGTIDDHGDAIKNSLKSFRLNDPTFFGKDLKVKRSRIETLPILPYYDNCIMRTQTERTRNPFQPEESPNQRKTMVVDGQPVSPIQNKNENMEVLSVYIRKDKGEKVPDGFQKLHYRGDSCKLHNPNERNRQILALQQVISETTSGAELAQSNRRFSPLIEKDTRVMTAVASPLQIPKTLYAPVVNSESDDSIESYKITKKTPKPERDDDSIDILPQRRQSQAPAIDEEDSRSGLFGCFRRGKVKRQQRDSYIEDKNFNSRRVVTHSDSPPKRHSDSVPNRQRKLSAEYSNRENF